MLSLQRWSTAVKVAMQAPKRSCSPLEREAKLAFAKGRLDEALAKMPKYCHDERVLLESLLAGRSAQEALQSMPHVKLFKLAYWCHSEC